jgi:3,4-dihydroxy 2-butanone 4-phosphate synthase/GTP cyclohydrolase II
MSQTRTESFQLNTIEEAIEDIKNGKVVIVVDDEDRENEGDFICASDCITPEIINFMSKHGRGLICTSITKARAQELRLPLMVRHNTEIYETAFTVSVDYVTDDFMLSGISAKGRAATVKGLVDPNAKPSDFTKPGHTMPLIAKDGGVLRRTGHTEASADLAALAGFSPSGVMVEIMNADGTMARLPQLMKIAKGLDVKVVSIEDLISYRLEKEKLVQRDLELDIDTALGKFKLIAFKEKNSTLTHLAITKGTWEKDEPVLTRVQSATNASELLGLIIKDSDSELSKAMKKIEEEGKGVLLLMKYHETEENLINTLKMLKEQQQSGKKLDSYTNRPSESVQRDLGIGSQILNLLGARKLRLLTTKPRKRVGLIGYGIEIVEEVLF